MKTSRIYTFMAFIMMLTIVSCNKEEFNIGEYSSAIFNATAELPSTRTTLDEDGKVTWTSGDKIAFYWQVDKAVHENDADYPYVSDGLQSSGMKAKFTIANASKTFVDAFINNIKTTNGRNLYAVYPSTIVSSYYKDEDHTGLDVYIPKEQDGSFENASISMAKWSTATPTDLSFYNLCALLRIEAGAGVQKILVKSNTAIAGQMYITFKVKENGVETNVDWPIIYKTGNEVSNEISVKANGAGTYYVAVRPTDIENLYVEFRGVDDVLLGGSNAGEILKAERAKIYALPTLKAQTDKLFVKVEGTGDGSSWDNAMNLAALEAYMETETAVSKKVYLAAGTYKHSSDFFQMPVGFELYGGYPATAKGYDLTGRNIKENATIIDGEWDGTSKEHNKRLFVIQNGSWIFDGLNFQNVQYTGEDHGSTILLIDNTEAVLIRNCTFTNCKNGNTSNSYYGGVLQVDAGKTLTLESCTFENNTGFLGGVAYVKGTLNATNCEFKNNVGVKSGGVIYAAGEAELKMDRCAFTTNKATGSGSGNGGGVAYLKGNAKLYLNRCSLVKNQDKMNAHHIFASGNSVVGINNSVVRGPYDLTTTSGSLLKLTGHCLVANTTMYCRTSAGAIAFETTEDSYLTNNIIINNSADKLSFTAKSGTKSPNIYNTIYSISSGTFNFDKSLSGADCGNGETGSFPTQINFWSANGDMGTKYQFEDGRSFYAFAWNGTTDLGNVYYTTIQDVKNLLKNTDFLTWLESDALKVNGVEALAVDIRGEARDTEKMWPGSYQTVVVENQNGASAENFNVL